MIAEIHVGDVGTVITITVYKEDGSICNLVTATTKEIIFKPPVGAKFTKTASFVTDGSDGKMKVIMGNEFTESGNWKLEAHVIDGGIENYSSIKEFTVKEHL